MWAFLCGVQVKKNYDTCIFIRAENLENHFFFFFVFWVPNFLVFKDIFFFLHNWCLGLDRRIKRIFSRYRHNYWLQKRYKWSNENIKLWIKSCEISIILNHNYTNVSQKKIYALPLLVMVIGLNLNRLRKL